MSKSKPSNDGQNLERDVHLRYCVQSGQSSIHGDTLLEFQTQESQSFAFYADKGEGKSGSGGPGTGKAVLYTPGQSCEVLGEGLKVRKPGDTSQLPAKIIECKRGDMIFECKDGNILLRARNIFIDACGGDQDGQFTVGTLTVGATGLASTACSLLGLTNAVKIHNIEAPPAEPKTNSGGYAKM